MASCRALGPTRCVAPDRVVRPGPGLAPAAWAAGTGTSSTDTTSTVSAEPARVIVKLKSGRLGGAMDPIGSR
ncbi:MAG: hypothetical protein WAQ08_13040 [Aquabacterium sp.]|uniref:hypothetical protein n=1 Tax=Aquabacterium sp. TaxID=1872578 RepID=UPI003BAFB23A